MERQYFEQMGMSPLTAPFNRNSRNYMIQQQLQLQHPMQVPLARPIPISMAPSGLSPVSMGGYSGYSTNRPFGSYSCPGEFNSFPLNDPTRGYHPDTFNCNEHRQCDLYPIRDGFHWSCAFPASPGSEPSPVEPVNFNNNIQEFPVPPGFYPDRFNGQRATHAVDFLPVADVADCTLTSSIPFGHGTPQPSLVTLVSPKSPMANNFHGTFPSVSPAPAYNNNAQSEPPTFHPNQFSGQEAMQAADILPVADVADGDRTLTLPMAFGSAQRPRVMVFDEKSPMAKYLEQFPPGEYTMEIRVIPTNSDNSNSGSSDNGFEEDSLNGDEGKERMKLVIL